jgi:hypothetical protein
MSKPSPALVISIIALFVALSGSAYAAAKINGKNIKQGTVTSKQIKNSSIKKVDLAKDARIAGPKGDAGANGKDGLSVLEGTLPPGKTITGNWSAAATNGAAATQFLYFHVPFPVRIPGLDSTKINFKSTGATTDDEDATCTGASAAQPTAPPGKVCLYAALQSYSVNPLSLVAKSATLPEAGFIIELQIATNQSFSAYGSWAYTAP